MVTSSRSPSRNQATSEQIPPIARVVHTKDLSPSAPSFRRSLASTHTNAESLKCSEQVMQKQKRKLLEWLAESSADTDVQRDRLTTLPMQSRQWKRSERVCSPQTLIRIAKMRTGEQSGERRALSVNVNVLVNHTFKVTNQSSDLCNLLLANLFSSQNFNKYKAQNLTLPIRIKLHLLTQIRLIFEIAIFFKSKRVAYV